MFLMHNVPRCSPSTGEVVDQVLVPVDETVFCDYCGKRHDYLENINKTSVRSTENVEPPWHEDRDFLGKYIDEEGNDFSSIDLYEFYNTQDEFHFCYDWHGFNCESRLRIEWINYFSDIQLPETVNNNIDLFLKHFEGDNRFLYKDRDRFDSTIYDMLCVSRYRVARHLVFKENLKPYELGILPYE